jgi:alpha-L-arabinofuranosidase
VQKIIDGQATLTDIGIPHKVETGKWYGLKLVVNPSNVELFVDGVSVYRYENKKTSRHYAVAGYDEQNRELVLKVVNAENEPYTAGINLKGTNDISANGRVITLSAENVTDENSFDNPKKIVPKESTFQTFGKKFDYVFPANSFTILRIKTGN